MGALQRSILFGGLASSGLVLGALVGAFWAAPKRVTGVLLAFASGSLIAALSFDLFPEAVALGGLWRAASGLIAGAGVFVALNTWLDRQTAHPGAERADQRSVVRAGSHGVGLLLLASVTLDGIPENLALGLSLEAAAPLTLLVAIFVSNLPEALVGALAMRQAGPRFVLALWTLTAILLTAAVVAGSTALADVSPRALSLPMAFAGGAVLASLADTLMPEAFEHGKPWNAFATAAGFLLSFALAEG